MSFQVIVDGQIIDECETLDECQKTIERDVEDAFAYIVRNKHGNELGVYISAHVMIDEPEEEDGDDVEGAP